MKKLELITELEIILEETKTGILSTVDTNGSPRMRWMTPTILKDRPDTIFALTSSGFEKTAHLENNARGEWMFQTKSLSTIITVRGVINLLDNSSLKNEVLEAIGSRLSAFWKLKSDDESGIIILETVVEEAVFFRPMTGIKKIVKFQ